MADRLEDMMYRVCILKDQYQRLKSELENPIFSPFSNPEDKPLIDGLASLIKEIEEKIKQEIELLNKTIRVSDVSNKALILLHKIDNAALRADITYKKWQKAIIDVSKCYITAYNNFETIMNDQADYQQDVANLISSTISVLSMGTLSWLSTVNQIADDVINKSDTIRNIAEDVLQGFSDKAISYWVPKYIAPKNTTPIEVTPKSPLMFKNNIDKELIQNCITIFERISKIMEYVTSFAENTNELSSKGIGREGGDKDSLYVFNLYRQLLKEIHPIIAKIINWSEIQPFEINEDKVTRNFEEHFWAKWLISLEGTTIDSELNPIYVRNKRGEIIDIPDIVETKKEKTSYKRFYWSDSLKDKLEGITKSGDLGRNVTTIEIERLVKWAKNYKPVQAL